MAHHPIWRPDSTKPVPSSAVPDPSVPEAAPISPSPSLTENSGAAESQGSDVAEWAAKFAAHGGGKIPAELSGELALDIVLNEVVEQAWLTTGATGSAIALVRDGEMVCRASGGVNAPELGTRLDANSGLSGACARTRQIQCCDDAFTDPRADAAASRDLGMRSVIVLPLLLDGELIGIFEIFSPRACAFGDRDLQTLEVLAQRVLRNTKARQSGLVSIALATPTFISAAPEENAAGRSAEEMEETQERREMSAPPESVSVPLYSSPAMRTQPNADVAEGGVEPERRFDWVTSVMGGIIVAVALLMTLVFAMRVGWLKASGQRRSPKLTTTASAKPAMAAAKQEKASASAPAQGAVSPASAPIKTNTGQAEPRLEKARGAEGGLRVFENGKEIFRMPASDVEMATGTEKDANVDSTLKSAGIVELAPDAAEGSLVRRVEPQYPEQALAQRVQGPVVLDVHISPQGEVMEIKVVSGDPLLVDAAIAAVKQWRFKPQALNGRAVEMQTHITLKFTLPPS